MNHLQALIQTAKNDQKRTVVIANAADTEILRTVKLGLAHKLCSFILLGNQDDIKQIANSIQLDLKNQDICLYHVKESAEEIAVEKIHNNEASILMKGNISTKKLLQAVLDREKGLRKEKLLSHVAMFDIPGRNKPILLTDAAINIAPNLDEKIQIINHATTVSRAVGIQQPKIAVIAPVDVMNEAIPSTIDAAKLTHMQQQGIIQNCLIDGPISFDNAISPKSAQHKSITSEVAGVADILLVSSIEVGNALYKSFVFFAYAKVAAVVCGAKIPIALSSRADSHESKLYSLALAITMDQEHETFS